MIWTPIPMNKLSQSRIFGWEYVLRFSYVFRCLLILLAILILCLCVTSVSAQSKVSDKAVNGIYIEAGSLEFKNREELIALVRQMREINVDEIYVETLVLGEAYFRSNLFSRAGNIHSSVLDPLIVILKEAHAENARPLKVFAVINPLLVYNGFAPVAPPPSHLYRAHPEWLTTIDLGRAADNSKEAWLDPGVPEVRAYYEKAVQSLCRDYPLDGIHFAQMRYPGFDRKRGYNKKALSAFAESRTFNFRPEPDNPKWIEWRTSQLTEMLKGMAHAAREARPEIIISASGLAESDAPSADNKKTPSYALAFQDWPGWCKNGIIDRLVLENFHSHKKHRARFLLWIHHGQSLAGDCDLLIGISGRKNYDSDVVAQIRQVFARRMNGALLYTYANPARDPAPGSNLLAFLGNTLFSPDYVVPHYALNEMQSGGGAKIVELPDNDTPPPIPLAVVDDSNNKTSSGTRKPLSKVDVTRALLGLDQDEPLGFTQTATSEKDIRQEPVPQEVHIPQLGKADTELRVYEIILNNGMQLEANIIEERPDGSLYIKLAGRLGGGTQLDLPASRIKSYKPLPDQKSTQHKGF